MASPISTSRLLTNLVLFQVGWFSCAFGGALGFPWVASAAAAIIVLIHLLSSMDLTREIKILVVLVALGTLFDTLLLQATLVSYQSPVPFDDIAPVWIVALWACFATTLTTGLRWLNNRVLLAFAFGFIGGPLAYLGGEALGAVVVAPGSLNLFMLAVSWGTMMIVVCRLPVMLRPDRVLRAGVYS